MARVLVLGGSSYVAQFVLQRLQQDKTLRVVNGDALEEIDAVACTMRSEPFALPEGFSSQSSVQSKRGVCVYWQVDLMALEAQEECVKDFHPTVIINCTAVSSPAVCQKEPEKAQVINEPEDLVRFLEKLPWRIRFVHLSTDFVYEGTQPCDGSYAEEDAVLSSKLSVYGAGKLRFDQFLQNRNSLTSSLQVLILRIANVIGPTAPIFPDRSASKFMQWLHHQLFQPENADEPLKLWSDEFRSYLYVSDLIEIMFRLLAVNAKEQTTLVNVGGAEALSRVEIAQKYLAASMKHNPKAVAGVTREIVPTSRAQIDLGYPSPLNTKLNTAHLAKLLPSFTWTPTATILNEISRSFMA
ncbi:Methionine adenosyltransferase 2 subunit beta [Phytophthora citrophthora]|uniref:Methionine adenosyltransferase 2 subunit beta n=1 Tax=Phytophthora citrophthora TaxID=4793 RepID=A0AAD9GUQ6_9STRA|nr:Methionine adenosyltransferase 2 subunit beta [Phytophthora citrophthora]